MARSPGPWFFVFAGLIGLSLGQPAYQAAPSCQAATVKFNLELQSGEQDRHASPVAVELTLPLSFEKVTRATVVDAAGKELPAQLTKLALLTPRPPVGRVSALVPAPGNTGAADAPLLAVAAAVVERQLNFIVPELPRGTTVHWTATISDEAPSDAAPAESSAAASAFHWQNTPGDHEDLLYGDRPLLRYMYQPLDESTPQRREETFKVFHHVFDPSGKILLTKGAGGKFTHHRGLFFGFNKVVYDGVKHCDIWHCREAAFQSHDALQDSQAGPVLGRHRVAVSWHGLKDEVFAKEQREVTVYRPAGENSGYMIEFASRVATTGGDVVLDGDPQHAGFHFRAAQEVADGADAKKTQTYYVRPDGVGKVGETRNYSWPQTVEQVNFPWKGMSVVVGGQRYTIGYLDKPGNPKESRFSERDYGRFGSYFEYRITPEKPLEVNYRIWIQPGEMQPDQIAALDNDFVSPIKATANATAK